MNFTTGNVTIKDVFTAIAIVISILTLYASWSKDRQLKKKERADKLRNSAALALATINRLKSHSMSLFVDCQPCFVEASKMLIEDYDVIRVRDYLWSSLDEINIKIYHNILSEGIESAYIGICTYHPQFRGRFSTVTDDLEKDRSEEFYNFASVIEQNAIDFEDKKDSYTTSDLGNKLRDIAFEYQNKLNVRLKKTSKALAGDLLVVIQLSDEELLRLDHNSGVSSDSIDI